MVWFLLNKTPARLLKTGLHASTVKAVRLVQYRNAKYPMLVTLPGIVKLVRLVQYWNVWLPMLVTLSGMVTFVKLRQ